MILLVTVEIEILKIEHIHVISETKSFLQAILYKGYRKKDFIGEKDNNTMPFWSIDVLMNDFRITGKDKGLKIDDDVNLSKR